MWNKNNIEPYNSILLGSEEVTQTVDRVARHMSIFSAMQEACEGSEMYLG